MQCIRTTRPIRSVSSEARSSSAQDKLLAYTGSGSVDLTARAGGGTTDSRVDGETEAVGPSRVAITSAPAHASRTAEPVSATVVDAARATTASVRPKMTSPAFSACERTEWTVARTALVARRLTQMTPWRYA